MKTLKLLSILGILTCLTCTFSCKYGAKNANTDIDSLTNHLKPGRHCYMATFEKDTARLNLNITTLGRITGRLTVKYYNTDTVSAKREPTDGELTIVEFKGDTLRADYQFESGPKGKTLYSNPVALLHKGDSLIMGHGRVYSYLGRSYFDPATPISFDKSRFHFAPVACAVGTK